MNVNSFVKPSSSIYNTTYKLYHYKEDFFRLVSYKKREKGWEKKITDKDVITSKSEIERISLSRVKREIREYCLCNDFKYFVTLTINSKNCNRFDLQECQNNLCKHIKEYSRRFKRNDFKFHYLLITEKHKDGAYHFHGLFSDLITNDIYINKNGYISSHFFDKRLRILFFQSNKRHNKVFQLYM